MKTCLITFLLLLSFTAVTKDYDFHWEIGKKSEGQLRLATVKKELDKATLTIMSLSDTLSKEQLILEKVLNGEVRANNFTADDAQFMHSRSLYIKTIIENYTQDKQLLTEIDQLFKPLSDYNRLHLKLREFFNDCQDCTQEEVDCSINEVLTDFNADDLILSIRTVKKKIVSINTRLQRAISATK
jgi:Mg2+ and Co2+ transporter CorA